MAAALSFSASVAAPAKLRAPARRAAAARPAAARAAYKADESQYFDLKDLESTTGSWDVYGVAEAKRYPELQNTFFERATAAVSRRDAMYSFLAFSSTASLLLWGAKGAKDAKLPITVGPQQKPALGPRDRL